MSDHRAGVGRAAGKVTALLTAGPGDRTSVVAGLVVVGLVVLVVVVVFLMLMALLWCGDGGDGCLVMAGCSLEFYILAISVALYGWALICDSAH